MIYQITENGNEFINEIPIVNRKLPLKIPKETAYIVILK